SSARAGSTASTARSTLPRSAGARVGAGEPGSPSASPDAAGASTIRRTPAFDSASWRSSASTRAASPPSVTSAMRDGSNSEVSACRCSTSSAAMMGSASVDADQRAQVQLDAARQRGQLVAALQRRDDAPFALLVGETRDLPAHPRVVFVAPAEMAHVVLAMRVESGRDEDHLRGELAQL